MTRTYACERFASISDIYDAACGCDLTVDVDDTFVANWLDVASDLLANLSGGVVSGRCLRTVRPVWRGSCGPASFDWTTRFGGLETIPLRGPNVDIVEILIDGAVVAASDYKLLDGSFLLRIGSEWPKVNDLRRDDSQANTFSITYRFNPAVDTLTFLACVELTCELIKDARGKPSGLPRGVTQASIQGATVQVANRAQALRDGDEQIPVVARWMSVYAPDGPNSVSGVWSPEIDQDWFLVEESGPSGS